MTRKEAIEWLNNLIETMKSETSGNYHDPEYKDEVYEAIDMAIEALKQEPTDDATLKDIFCMGCECKEQEPNTDAVSRQYLVDEMKKLFEMGDCYCDKYLIIGTINQAPSVNTNVCIDAVSRQAVQEANTISIELKENPHKMWQRIQNLPSVTPIQTCDDAVSRQAVDELSKELVHTTRDKADFLCNFWEGLQKLPPVTPTRPKGHWEETRYRSVDQTGETYDDGVGFRCSICANVFKVTSLNRYNYCPNCGADMREGEK